MKNDCTETHGMVIRISDGQSKTPSVDSQISSRAMSLAMSGNRETLNGGHLNFNKFYDHCAVIDDDPAN